MRGKVRWITHLTFVLAVIAAVVIAAPAIGGPSLKQLVKKEVAKQIGKATGPAGPAGAPGATGTPGTPGTDGTARAYANVLSHAFMPCSPACSFNRSKGIAGVTHPFVGVYCVNAPGIDPASVPAAATVELADTPGNLGNTSTTTFAGASGCPSGRFEVITQRQPVTAVRNTADTGSVDVAGNAVYADDVSFTIVIP
jgi:hypothetical protein